ncbi:hypothetical protein B0H12DRAFT_1242138 [Mycena haematopus]|nr:hypothetical protein B0H12DRAFT_1242138 [Mycena haematopus]
MSPIVVPASLITMNWLSLILLLVTWLQSWPNRLKRLFESSHISVAQDCNEDTLRLIFEHCSDSTLASAGRVCRTWVIPAQQELFSVLPSKTPKRRGQWEVLGNVLISSPRLRSYVRQVQVFPTAMEDLDHYRWIPLLPQAGLLSLELLAFPNDSLHAALGHMLLASPEFSALQRLVVSGLALRNSAVLQRCLSNPSLKHLGIIFLGFSDPLLSLCPSKTLSRLSIRTWGVPEDIDALIRACGATLRRFDLGLTHQPDPCGYARLGSHCSTHRT